MTVAATGQSVSEPLALVVTSGSHCQNWSPVSNHGMFLTTRQQKKLDPSNTKEEQKIKKLKSRYV